MEYKVKEGILISGKTYCLVLENGDFIRKAKGVDENKLGYNDYMYMLTGTNVEASKTISNKDYQRGSVSIIVKEGIILDSDAFKKKDKKKKLYK